MNAYHARNPNLGGRLVELLDAVKAEFENVTQEASAYKNYKDDYEHKIASQIQEMQSMRQNVYELQMAHEKMKQVYEEEITRLRRELDAKAGAGPHPSATAGPGGNFNFPANNDSAPRPKLGTPSNIFGGIIAGKGGQALPAHTADVQSGNGGGAQPGRPTGGPQQGAGPAGYANGHHANGGGSIDSKKQLGGYPDAARQGGPMPIQQQQQQAFGYGGQGGAQQGPASTQQGGPTLAAPAELAPQQQQQQQAPIAAPEPVRQSFTELDIDSVPREMKKEGSDWFAVFNPNVARTLDVNLVHTLDHNSVVCCARFSADGKFLATGCNRAANIFDVKTGQKATVLEDTDASTDGDLYIRSVAFSPDGTQLATGAEDKVIRVWDIASKKVRHVFTGHEQDIYSLDFSKNGRFVASGSGDRTARVWDLEGGQQVLTLSIEDAVTTVAISPDGNYIAAGSLDKVVRVWDAKTGYLVERLEGHKDSVYSVAFSPNGKDLYSGSLDKTVKLWELSAPRGIPASSTPKGGVCRMDFAGHKDFVLSVAPSPDGQWLISGSKDRSVHFWDPRSAQVQLLLQGHKNSVISVSASPQGHLFATGSGDCKARIWSYETLQ